MTAGDRARSARVPAVLVCAAALAGAAACTIVYDDEKEKKAATETTDSHAQGFDAATWVEFGRRADTEGSPWSFAVKGTGKLVSVNTESRAGTMQISVDTPSGEESVTLQIGPVVRGTAIRDNLPFVSFGDVTNQIQFAQVSRALNDRAVAGVHPTVDSVKAPGTTVEFSGAMNVSGSDDSVLITPLTLKRAGGK